MKIRVQTHDQIRREQIEEWAIEQLSNKQIPERVAKVAKIRVEGVQKYWTKEKEIILDQTPAYDVVINNNVRDKSLDTRHSQGNAKSASGAVPHRP